MIRKDDGREMKGYGRGKADKVWIKRGRGREEREREKGRKEGMEK